MNEYEAIPSDRMGLRDYLVVMRRRWRMVALVFVAVVLLALGYSFAQTPQYLTYADVAIEASSADVAASGSTEVSAEEVATQAQVVTSQPVARLVAKRLNLVDRPDLNELVSVEVLGSSRILRITARDTDPQRAAETANAVARSYLAYRQDQSAQGFELASKVLSARQGAVQEQLNSVETQLKAAGTPAARIELQAQRRSLQTRLGQLSTELGSLQDSLSASPATGEVLHSAVAPATPISPRPALTGVLGGLLGLMLGFAAAVLRDRFDDVVYDEDMVRRALGGSVVLGRISRWGDESTYRNRLVTLLAPHSASTEGYQRLAVNLRFLLATVRKDRDSAAVALVTSAQTSEGKTVTSCNLAVAAARLGLRVVLVDGDLRRAGAAVRFGLGDPPGLSDLLASEDPAAAYLVDVGLPGLRFLPAGTIPPNPAALLSSARMRMVLEEMAADADLIVVDSPALMAVADTLELATLADLVLVVAREGVSRRRELVTVMESLRHVGAGSVSAVYNAFDEGGHKVDYYTPRERITTPLPPAVHREVTAATNGFHADDHEVEPAVKPGS